MLMHSFKPAADLGISERNKEGLMKVLVLLETKKLHHIDKRTANWSERGKRKFTGHFNMAVVVAEYDCGTAACICGTAQLLGYTSMAAAANDSPALMGLFCGHGRPLGMRLNDLTPAQAARALRSYLTTGDAKWAEAVSVTD